MTEFKNPKLAADGVILSGGEIVLIKRRNYPFQGKWALPGGFVDYGETVEHATVREMKEETGLEVEITRLVGVYSDPARDPRGHAVSVVYLCKIAGGTLKGGNDASEAKRFRLDALPDLAFDHKRVIEDALKIEGGHTN